jgi:hypothetical protein
MSSSSYNPPAAPLSTTSVSSSGNSTSLFGFGRAASNRSVETNAATFSGGGTGGEGEESNTSINPTTSGSNQLPPPPQPQEQQKKPAASSTFFSALKSFSGTGGGGGNSTSTNSAWGSSLMSSRPPGPGEATAPANPPLSSNSVDNNDCYIPPAKRDLLDFEAFMDTVTHGDDDFPDSPAKNRTNSTSRLSVGGENEVVELNLQNNNDRGGE